MGRAATADLGPGKRTRVDGIAAMPGRATTGAAPDDAVHDTAQRGTAGAGGKLPHLDVIQRLFGRHDVGGVQAHVGGDAGPASAELGAQAYAMGNHVAFAGAPDLHTAAHEAAHVVQQRGGVQLKGGVGAHGDAYEQHADAVADAVVAGRPAEALLDRHAGSGGATPSVQRKITVGKEQLHYDTAEQAYTALRSTFPTAPEADLRFHLGELSRTNTGFQNFVNLKHEITRRLASGQLMVGTTPHYGTDVSIHTSKETAIENFQAALRAGFRSFDTATFYKMGLEECSLIALADAAKAVGVRPDELHVLYKVMPPDEDRGIVDPLEAQIENAAKTLSQYPETLVLHEVTDLEAGQADLGKLIALVKKGKGKQVGVSNVSIVYLEPLHAHSVELGVPLKVVQNRFNPYHQDTDVRQFCDRNGIKYLGYSVLGSAQQGVCHEDGQGDPRQFLVPMQDPRVLALAERHGLSAGSMLLSWSHQKGISAVTFTTSGQKRDEQNLAAAGTPLTPDLMRALDALMTTPPDPASRDFGTKHGLAALYAALRDPTGWYIMDELCKAGHGALLLDDLANQIITRNPAPVAQQDALKNFGLNLMRFAADLQSPANKRAKTWLPMMQELFGGLATAAGGDRAEVRELCIEWACKNSEQGGHAQNAIQDIEQIISGQYVPARPITDAGRANQPRAVVAQVAQVQPVAGTVLQITVDQAPQFFDEAYTATAFADVGPGIYNINYLGQFNIRVQVTATLGQNVTATVLPPED